MQMKRFWGLLGVALLCLTACTSPNNGPGSNQTKHNERLSEGREENGMEINANEGEQNGQGEEAEELTLSQMAVVHEGDEARIIKAMQKSLHKEPTVLGFIGGSITEGAWSSAPDKSYAGLVAKWWEQKFPEAPVSFINAGIGATDSYLGVHRVDEDLLQEKPDFVVVEFAVNDGPSPHIPNAFEGLVRKILLSENQPGVLLFFMTRNNGTNEQMVHKGTGIRYDLPMVSFRDAVWPQIEAGQIKWEEIYPDEIHPNDAGHQLAAQLITDRLEQIYAHARETAGPIVIDDELPEPYTSGGYTNAKLYASDNLAADDLGGWAPGPTLIFSPGWIAQAKNDPLVFTVEGTNIGIIYEKLNNGTMGRVKVQIDEMLPRTIEGHFESATFGGFAAYELFPDLPPGKHVVSIQMIDSHHAGSTGENFRIAGITVAN